MRMKNWSELSLSEKLSRCCSGLSLLVLLGFGIYGAVYQYFDTVVFGMILLGALLAEIYVELNNRFADLANLGFVCCLSFALGLFFLNSYPVWADRLNNITMYGSRGTLKPVVAIMALIIVTVVIGIVSCFMSKNGGDEK